MPSPIEVTITAVGPDNVRLADPIIHEVTRCGANIHEIQMYDHDSEKLFAMLLRAQWPQRIDELRDRMKAIAAQTGLAVRSWAKPVEKKPKLAICVTRREETGRALLQGIQDGVLNAEAAVMISNREHCHGLADEFSLPWHNVGDAEGSPDNEELAKLFDRYDVDYIILARYMRVLPPFLCWSYAGGRIINLHHGLLPSFPGLRPYEDAYERRMLTFGATAHFIVPELDAGGQTIHQTAFSVPPSTALSEIKRIGQTQNEPACLLEGVRRVVDREVELHFHRVVSAANSR